MASQRFCLRWNNHQSNLLSVFDQLLHAETFTDVTLAVEGQYLKAHKMVLSACSPYFQQIFVNHPEKHPIVILKDVPFADMKSLLDFMYRGEVSVDQERLTAFLRVAESLRIKGLTEVNEEKPSTKSHTPPPNLRRISSLFAQQQQQQQQQQQRHSTESRPSSQSMAATNQVLASALSGQKRKRGRPRKLSGSDVGEDLDDFDRENLVQGSPDEVLDVKMAADQFSSSCNEASDENGVSRSIDDHEDSTQDIMDTPDGIHRKSSSTPQPAASTSKDTSPRKDDPSDSMVVTSQSAMAMPSIIPNLGLLISKNLENHLGNNHVAKIRINPMTQQQFSIASDSMVTKSPAHTTHESAAATSTSSSLSSSTTHQPATSSKDDFKSPPPSSTTTPTTTTQNSNNNAFQQNNNNNNSNSNSNLTTVPIITSVTSLAASNGGGSGGGAQQQQPSSSCVVGAATTSSTSSSSPSRQPARRRIRRKGSSPDDQAEQLTEMSVRGLNLFRYASISEGVYKCTECAKENVEKTFKNKYSFQRHAFLYHEGTQRKVFPCPVCGREFSRPDKMKNHMKTTHEYIGKDTASNYPLNFLLGSGGDVPNLSLLKNENESLQQQANATMEYLRQQSADNSLQLQMIGFNSALSLQMPKLESLLPTTQ